ncbi:hypothetical protein FAES_1609 [Fibrella aestuarina BUZ 2]|uniref:FHA domain-containing protein n=1 Tax=Fibrella aestuarina BUZ 2 TaxID=1166018 RepID=I0K666_9BACT|nr:FHA domain-containing protein [Fibrella aestuarina]CCG99619.1 hypothetical protein FAES_1609 [Fibrella aestuarina BUZ 2]
MDKPNRFLQKLNNLLVPKAVDDDEAKPVSSEQILHALLASFDASLERESIGNKLLFNAHYLIVLHPTAYEQRLAALPAIVDEAVRLFIDHLRQRKGPHDQVMPVSSHWFFKFGPGTEYNGEAIGVGDLKVVGSLSGQSVGESPRPVAQRGGNKVTRKVQNTNVFDTLDTNRQAFSHIDFRESGAFAVDIDLSQFAPPVPQPAAQPQAPANVPAAPMPASPQSRPAPGPQPQAFARIDCYMADLNTEETYWMQDREVVLARREPDNEAFPNYIRLNSPYVSNPHARIRFNDTTQSFELASFSRNETRINEQVVARSDPGQPQWVPLPSPSQILLNGVVTLQFSAQEGMANE